MVEPGGQFYWIDRIYDLGSVKLGFAMAMLLVSAIVAVITATAFVIALVQR